MHGEEEGAHADPHCEITNRLRLTSAPHNNAEAHTTSTLAQSCVML